MPLAEYLTLSIRTRGKLHFFYVWYAILRVRTARARNVRTSLPGFFSRLLLKRFIRGRLEAIGALPIENQDSLRGIPAEFIGGGFYDLRRRPGACGVCAWLQGRHSIDAALLHSRSAPLMNPKLFVRL